MTFLLVEIIYRRWWTNKWVRIIEEMKMTGEERRTLMKSHMSTTLCITAHTWTRLEWKQNHRFESLATTRLSHSMASITLNMSPAYRWRNCKAWRTSDRNWNTKLRCPFVRYSSRTRVLSVAYVLGLLVKDGLQLECQLFNRVQKNHLLVLPLLRKLVFLGMNNIVSIAALLSFTCQANFTKILVYFDVT